MYIDGLDDLYQTVEICTLTGWSIEYVENLGLLNREAILQMSEAKRVLDGSQSSKPRSRTRP